MFKTCFVARVTVPPQQKAYICCRLEPTTGWQSPPDENLLAFCFPLGAENVRPKEYMRPEEFSFTLTAGDGSRLHGFCRRTLPSRSKVPVNSMAPSAAKTAMLRYPQVLCIVSQHPWFPFYYKVLELVEKMLRQEDLGAGAGATQEWPRGSPAAAFLSDLLLQLGGQGVQLGQVVRVRLPAMEQPLDFSPPRRALTRGASLSPTLHADRGSVELEVPPDLGLGPDNAGISAARLLFHLPPRVALSLIASLLMERRIILVASAEDKVSAAVHAAAALIHPFRWQHIYLPLLPLSLKDYLAAPMPYLVGLNSECLPMLRTMALEEVLIVDLDLGECSPPPDNPNDDAFLLPYASKLLSALETCKDGTLSSTEFNSTPFIASVMQEYFLKLVGKYRLYIQPDLTDPTSRAELRGKNGAKADDVLRAHGYLFDQAAFVGQRKSPEVREFLQQFRHSQMFEVFVTERLRMAAALGGPASSQDAFEAKVSQLMSKQAMFGGAMMGMMGVGAGSGAQGQSGGGRFSAMLKKTANAMRQSSDSLVKGLKQLGSTQEEGYASMPRRQSTSFSLQRVSPVAGLHAVGQGGAGAKAGGHSRSPSQSQMPRVASFSRASPSQAVGSHQRLAHVSLEDVNPDLFFEGIVDEDAGSEASEGSGYARSGNSSPGPLEQGATRNKTFSSLFRLSASQSAAPSPRHQLQQMRSGSSGKSNSSPSLVSLDVTAGPDALLPPAMPQQQQQQHRANQPHQGAARYGPAQPLIDLFESSVANAGQPTNAFPAVGAPQGAVGAVGPLPHAVRPHLLAPSGGSGAFGSPVSAQAPRRLPSGQSPLAPSSLSASPRGFGGGEVHSMPQTMARAHLSHLAPSPEDASLSSAILGVLQQSANHSAAASPPARQSTGSGGNEWTAFAAASYGQASSSSQLQQRPATGAAGAGPLHGSGRLTGAADWQQQGPGPGPLRSSMAGSLGGPGPAALNSRMAVKADAFGGLLADTVSSVSVDLAVRRRTSSQDRAAAGPSVSTPQTQQDEPSWADFTGAAAAAEFGSGSGDSRLVAPPATGAAGVAGGQQQRQLEHTFSWGEWSAFEAAQQVAAELGQKCST